MSKREVHLWFQDILGAIQHIMAFADNIDYGAFCTDLKTKHAILHNFSIIGEAVSKIPADYQQSHPEVAWREIKGFRNYVVHEYFGLDDSITWDIIQIDLQPLHNTIAKLLEEERSK